MRFVVVLSPEHKGVYSYDPDNGSTSAVAVASDNSVRSLPWSLDECAQNGLGFVVLPSFQKAKDLIINLNRIEDGCSSLLSVHACMNDLLFKLMDPVTRHEFSRTTKCIELMRDWGHWPEIADTLLFKDRVAMNLVVDWLNLISPQHPVQLQYGETCGRCSPFCVCLHVVAVCALIHSCLYFVRNKIILGIRSAKP
jgi:hypothetical protein